jgi:hypothetical protein
MNRQRDFIQTSHHEHQYSSCRSDRGTISSKFGHNEENHVTNRSNDEIKNVNVRNHIGITIYNDWNHSIASKNESVTTTDSRT